MSAVCCAFLLWTIDDVKPLIMELVDERSGGGELEHFVFRISRRLGSLPNLFNSATGRWSYISKWSKNLDQLNLGYIIRTEDSHLLSHIDALLDRLLGLLEFFCGSPLDEAKLLPKIKLAVYLAFKMIGMPVLSTARLSNGELMSQIRTNLPRDLVPLCQPAGRKLRLAFLETASFIISPSKTLCRITGSVTVDNPLASDMMLQVSPSIKLKAGKFVPWNENSSRDIPIQLGHYTLASYETDRIPFDIDFRDNKITIMWNSSCLSDDTRVLKCQLGIPIKPSTLFSISSFTLDPPTLAHAVSYDTSQRMIKWDFFHLVPATQYSLSIPEPIQASECTLDFQLNNCLVSGQTCESRTVFQQSTGISAELQLEVTRHSVTSSKFRLIRF